MDENDIMKVQLQVRSHASRFSHLLRSPRLCLSADGLFCEVSAHFAADVVSCCCCCCGCCWCSRVQFVCKGSHCNCTAVTLDGQTSNEYPGHFLFPRVERFCYPTWRGGCSCMCRGAATTPSRGDVIADTIKLG